KQQTAVRQQLQLKPTLEDGEVQESWPHDGPTPVPPLAPGEYQQHQHHEFSQEVDGDHRAPAMVDLLLRSPYEPAEEEQEESEGMIYDFGEAEELPEHTEEPPPPEEGPQLISVTGDEYFYHRVPMEGLRASKWPEAAPLPTQQLLQITDDSIHVADSDNVIGISDADLHQASTQAFAADVRAAVDKGPATPQQAEEGNK
ncbi:unnamed protein product, partial [Closterium sp. NIES-54]